MIDHETSRRGVLAGAAALVAMPTSAASALGHLPGSSEIAEIAGPLREDFMVSLALFCSDIDTARDAFERYVEICEAEIGSGRQHPFASNKRTVERLLKQLHRDSMMGPYRRPDPAARAAAIEAANAQWEAHLDSVPDFQD